MLPLSMNPVAQLSCEALRLGCEAYSLIGLRLFKMATGGVPAVSEALRMVPEKITALIDAQVLIAASILSGRPDLALGRVVALYRDRVSDNEQRLTSLEAVFTTTVDCGLLGRAAMPMPMSGVPEMGDSLGH